MSVKYNIDAPNEYAADLWKILTENFNVILTKKQHSIDGETLYIEVKITKNGT